MAAEDSEGRSCLPRTRKTRALLAVLAMASPKPVLRQRLASLLWSRRELEQARGSLRQSVHELQDTLGFAWGHVLITDRHYLSLRGPEIEVDALKMAQPAVMSQEVLQRFQDVLLEDLNGLDTAFDRWLDEERRRFQRIGRSIGETLLAKSDDPVSAGEAAEGLLAIDRLHEGAWRAVIRSYADRGDIGAAMTAYDRCRGVLAEHSNVRPSPETEELMDRVRGSAAKAKPAEAKPADPASVDPGGRNEPAAVVSSRFSQRRGRATVRLLVAPLRTIGAEMDDGLALGLAEEISAGLSRFRWISCLTGGLWPGAAPGGDVAGAHAALDADLVLEGTIQYGVGRVRIIVRLVDLRFEGEIAWAGRFDRPLTDPLSMQDELGAAIVAQVDPELMKHESRRTATARSDEMTAHDLLLQALPAIYRLERSSYLEARRLLEASLEADPSNSVAHGWLAYWHLLHVGQGWADDPAAASAEAARLAERAVMLDPGDARALTLAGHVRGFLGKHPEEASALHERAIKLNPNLAIAWCFSGLSNLYLGQHEEALRRVQTALRLSPSDPHVFFFDMALVMPYLMNGDYPAAVEAGRRAVELNPLFSSAYKGYLAALGWMHPTREAGKVLERLLELEPDFSIEAATQRSPLRRPEDVARYAEGLRRAGLRERGPANHPPGHSGVDLTATTPHSRSLVRHE